MWVLIVATCDVFTSGFESVYPLLPVQAARAVKPRGLRRYFIFEQDEIAAGAFGTVTRFLFNVPIPKFTPNL